MGDTEQGFGLLLPRFSQEYYGLLKKHQVPVEFINIAGEGHEILLNEQVLAAIGRMVK